MEPGWHAFPPEPLEETPCPFCGQPVEVPYCEVQVIADDIWRYTAHLACVQQHIDLSITPP
jgi:hypothetical protein